MDYCCVGVLASAFLGINFIHKTCMLLISLLTMWRGFIVLFCDRKSIPLWIIEVQVLSLYRMRNLTLYANKIRPLMLSTIHSHVNHLITHNSVARQFVRYIKHIFRIKFQFSGQNWNSWEKSSSQLAAKSMVKSTLKSSKEEKQHCELLSISYSPIIVYVV